MGVLYKHANLIRDAYVVTQSRPMAVKAQTQ
jgi:hypothetical protein